MTSAKTRSGRTRRAKLMTMMAGVALALASLVAVSPAAQAITCPPGFEMLPGCTNGGGGGGGSSNSPTPAGTWSTETIAGMSVRIYVPSTQPVLASGRALMIGLHGCVQKAGDLQTAGNWTATAEEYGMVVALPDAPNGGVILGCWDYYDANHSRTSPSRHDDNLLDLTAALKGRSGLGIDPDQVYISGLSSGGGQTMVMGCLAPDVYAGIGINAGPTVGTTSSQISSVAVSKAQGANTCRTFAGSALSSFGTQLTSVVFGSSDSTVATGYGTLNGQIMAEIYGATSTSSFSLSDLPGNNTNGTGTLYADGEGPRVSVISNTGVAHAWPAGAGSGGTYITANSIDYPAYVTSFFFENNRRVDRSTTPTPGPTPTPTQEPTPAPTPTPTPVDDCVTATNAEHKAAGRAISYGVDPYNPYYAVGSQAYLGLGDATVTSLQTGSNGSYLLIASCE